MKSEEIRVLEQVFTDSGLSEVGKDRVLRILFTHLKFDTRVKIAETTGFSKEGGKDEQKNKKDNL